MVLAVSAFNFMSHRIIKVVIPRLDAPSFVLSREKILTRELTGADEVLGLLEKGLGCTVA
jgi:hypothetical protein